MCDSIEVSCFPFITIGWIEGDDVNVAIHSVYPIRQRRSLFISIIHPLNERPFEGDPPSTLHRIGAACGHQHIQRVAAIDRQQPFT